MFNPKAMKSSLFRCLLAVIAIAGLNVLTPSLGFAQNQSETSGGAQSAEL